MSTENSNEGTGESSNENISESIGEPVEASPGYASIAAARAEEFLSETPPTGTPTPMTQENVTHDCVSQEKLCDWSCDDLQSPAVGWFEIIALILAVVLVDATIYHGAGFAGLAMFVFVLPILLLLGTPRRFQCRPDVPVSQADQLVGAANQHTNSAAAPKYGIPKLLPLFLLLTLVTSLKLVWCGFAPTFLVGLFLVIGVGVLLTGRKLHITAMIVYLLQAIFTGGHRLMHYKRSIKKLRWFPSKTGTLAVMIPLLILILFGVIFVFANPNLIELFEQWHRQLVDWFQYRLANLCPSLAEVLLWGLTVWLMIGWLRPMTGEMFWEARDYLYFFIYSDMQQVFSERKKRKEQERIKPEHDPEQRSEYYAMYRNTLITVMVFFAIYLLYEFQTLWLQPIPEKFDYVGYAHRGAAWLTVALAVSTIILSTIFCKVMYADKRISHLKMLAWVWSAENMILVIAVYHRLMIYINYNGMTRMRVIGLLGVTAVLIGFVFVIVKIAKQRNFEWLLHRYFWAVLTMVFLNFVLPVDMIVHNHNTKCALNGYYPPTVQMCVHPNSSEGYLSMIPLIDCQDEIISEGVRAQLAEQLHRLEVKLIGTHSTNSYRWTEYQLADVILYNRLNECKDKLTYYLDYSDERELAKKKFYNYTYSRWY